MVAILCLAADICSTKDIPSLSQSAVSRFEETEACVRSGDERRSGKTALSSVRMGVETVSYRELSQGLMLRYTFSPSINTYPGSKGGKSRPLINLRVSAGFSWISSVAILFSFSNDVFWYV